MLVRRHHLGPATLLAACLAMSGCAAAPSTATGSESTADRTTSGSSVPAPESPGDDAEGSGADESASTVVNEVADPYLEGIELAEGVHLLVNGVPADPFDPIETDPDGGVSLAVLDVFQPDIGVELSVPESGAFIPIEITSFQDTLIEDDFRTVVATRFTLPDDIGTGVQLIHFEALRGTQRSVKLYVRRPGPAVGCSRHGALVAGFERFERVTVTGRSFPVEADARGQALIEIDIPGGSPSPDAAVVTITLEGSESGPRGSLDLPFEPATCEDS